MKNHFSFFLLTILAFLSVELTAQVAINNNGDLPDASSALDISSTSKGLLIPRMTTAERVAIDSPANGLIVFDTDTKSVWFFSSGLAGWINVYGSNKNIDTLSDLDSDTRIHVEYYDDEDMIRIYTAGTEFFNLDSARIEVLNSGGSVFLGENAGKKDDYSSNNNVAVGNSALEDNIGGSYNIAIGTFALQTSVEKTGNVAMGYSSMRYYNDDLSQQSSYNTAIGMNTMVGTWPPSNNTGIYNVALGAFALNKNTSGSYNMGVGYSALKNNTEGNNNTGLGYRALQSNVANSRQTAIGYQAMFYADDRTTGREAYNTALGYEALMGSSNSTVNIGQYNTAIGDIALTSNTNGDNNTAVGASSLLSNTWGSSNIGVGKNALANNTTGSNNIAIGQDALGTNVSNSMNTAIGYDAMGNADNSGGSYTYNTALGSYALRGGLTPASNTGKRNTSIGANSMFWNTSGSDNVAFGEKALYYNTSGTYNTAIGQGSLYNNKANSRSTAIGVQAMYRADNRTTGRETYNTAIGFLALSGSSSTASNTGQYNTAIGDIALASNSTGEKNVAVGASSLTGNTTGYENAAIGMEALSNNTTGRYNTAVGSGALLSNNGMGYNTAIGFNSMCFANSSATSSNAANTAVGAEALRGSTTAAANTGIQNVSIGSKTMINSTSASNNSALGYGALYLTTTGSNNVAVGNFCGDENYTGNYNILIGDNVNALTGSSSNQLNIGNTIYGTGIYQTTYKIGIGTSAPEEELDVRGELQVKNSAGLGKIIIDGTSGNSSLEFRNSGAYGGAFGYNSTNDNLFLYHGGNVVLKNGQFGVGTTTPGYTLQVGNSGDGSSARANAWNTFSDRRWKKNMVVIDHPIEKLNMLNGYYYNWKEGEDPSVQVGVIAQEVEMALPEIVSTDSAGYKSVDYSKITALLIEVNKAQQKQIDELVKTVEIQNKKIDQLLKTEIEK